MGTVQRATIPCALSLVQPPDETCQKSFLVAANLGSQRNVRIEAAGEGIGRLQVRRRAGIVAQYSWQTQVTEQQVFWEIENAPAGTNHCGDDKGQGKQSDDGSCALLLVQPVCCTSTNGSTFFFLRRGGLRSTEYFTIASQQSID